MLMEESYGVVVYVHAFLSYLGFFLLFKTLETLVALHSPSTCWKQPTCLSDFLRDNYSAEVLWQTLYCSIMTLLFSAPAALSSSPSPASAAAVSLPLSFSLS